MTGRLSAGEVDRLLAGVVAADRAVAAAWPGAPGGRQPLQVLYVPADRVTATTARDAGAEALRLLSAHAPDARSFADAVGLSADVPAAEVRERVAAKLAEEPVEDLRVDFEDGYIGRDSAQEDADAVTAGRAVAALAAGRAAPPFVGLRVKPFGDGLARRSLATLDRFLGALLEGTGGLPDGFVVTFPKIVAVDHVAAFADALGALEDAHGLAAGDLGFEAQVETTQSLLAADGTMALRALRDAAGGRLRAVHFGVYDFTAALGLPPAEQRLDHPACDWARHLLQVAFAGTEVRLADGSTNVVPAADTAAELRRVWRRHAADVRHSLVHGFVQGWDLHPAHLVSRYAVVFADLLAHVDEVLDRVATWRHGASGGPVLDEPATVRMLTERLQRAVDCGALHPSTVGERTGLGLQRRARG